MPNKFVSKKISVCIVQHDGPVNEVVRVERKAFNRSALVYHAYRKLGTRGRTVRFNDVVAFLANDGVLISPREVRWIVSNLSSQGRDELMRVSRGVYKVNPQGTVKVQSTQAIRTMRYDRGVTQAVIV